MFSDYFPNAFENLPFSIGQTLVQILFENSLVFCQEKNGIFIAFTQPNNKVFLNPMKYSLPFSKYSLCNVQLWMSITVKWLCLYIKKL